MEKVASIYEKTFTQWMTVKSCKVKPTLFTDLTTRCPSVSFCIIPHMIESTRQSNKPKTFQLIKAFEIIALSFKSLPKNLEEESKVKDLVSAFSSSIVETLILVPELGEKGPFGMPKERLKELIKSIGIVVRRFKGPKEQYGNLPQEMKSVSQHEIFKTKAFESIVKQTLQLMI